MEMKVILYLTVWNNTVENWMRLLLYTIRLFILCNFCVGSKLKRFWCHSLKIRRKNKKMLRKK